MCKFLFKFRSGKSIVVNSVDALGAAISLIHMLNCAWIDSRDDFIKELHEIPNREFAAHKLLDEYNNTAPAWAEQIAAMAEILKMLYGDC